MPGTFFALSAWIVVQYVPNSSRDIPGRRFAPKMSLYMRASYQRCADRVSVRARAFSERDLTGADQHRQAAALVCLERGVQFGERGRDRFLHGARGVGAVVRGDRGGCTVEGVALERVGQRGRAAAVLHLGLRALDLQPLEDARRGAELL